jgi:hypothetical protein
MKHVFTAMQFQGSIVLYLLWIELSKVLSIGPGNLNPRIKIDKGFNKPKGDVADNKGGESILIPVGWPEGSKVILDFQMSGGGSYLCEGGTVIITEVVTAPDEVKLLNSIFHSKFECRNLLEPDPNVKRIIWIGSTVPPRTQTELLILQAGEYVV